jgi:hypothetical protein
MSVSGFWIVKSILDNNARQLAESSERRSRERHREEIKKLEEENRKLKQPERSKREDLPVKPPRCYHSYHQNQDGWWELQRYGCKCTKDAVL